MLAHITHMFCDGARRNEHMKSLTWLQPKLNTPGPANKALLEKSQQFWMEYILEYIKCSSVLPTWRDVMTDTSGDKISVVSFHSSPFLQGKMFWHCVGTYIITIAKDVDPLDTDYTRRITFHYLQTVSSKEMKTKIHFEIWKPNRTALWTL